MMPFVTGVEFYKKLLELVPEQAARVVFLTGGAFTATARAFLDEVPNARMDKPFEVQNLRALVNDRIRLTERVRGAVATQRNSPKTRNAMHSMALVPPMVTLRILGGRREKIRAGDVLGALTGGGIQRIADRQDQRERALDVRRRGARRSPSLRQGSCRRGK